MSFNDLQLSEPVLRALNTEGYTNPTPIQEKAIPVILQKRDLLGCAQTGTGKTAAFTIPILQMMYEQKQHTSRYIRALILTPTRELAIQVGDSLKAYGRFLPLRYQVVFGGVPQFNQVQGIRRGVDFLVATPGRLLDLVQQKHISLAHIQFFVLDEADRMLDMGFIHDVKRIIEKLPANKQTLFFSATMPPAIRQLAAMLLKDPIKAEVSPPASTVDMIEQSVFFAEKQNKLPLLTHLLKNPAIETALIFTKTKHGADRLAKNLHKAGIYAGAIHGNKAQHARQKTLSSFKNKNIRVLVATDIAARGIDIDELSHVINYDLPDVPETYVHRIGRTGRAGASGIAISFCDWSEKILLTEIEKLIRKQVPVVKGHPYDVTSMHALPAQVSQSYAFNGRRSAGRGRRNRTFMQRA